MQGKSPALLSRWTLYPLLLALYAVVYFYAENIAQINAAEVAVVALVTLVITAIIHLLTWLIARNRHTAAAIAAVWVVAIFSYGHVNNLVQPARFGIDASMTIALLLGIAIIVSVVLLRRRTPVSSSVTLFANVVTLALMAMPLLRIAAYHAGRLGTAEAVTAASDTTAAGRDFVANSAEYPDVYYLILDGYSSNSHFLRGWGYDNSAFTDALEERGFVVTDDSRTNYAITLMSIASSLNMRYIEQSERQPTREGRQAYLYTIAADNAVARQLQQQGYKYVHIMSGFGHYSRIADENIDVYRDGVRHYTRQDPPPVCQSLNNCNQIPFVRYFLESTLLLPLLETSAGQSIMNSIEANADENRERPLHFDSSRRALAIWDEVESIAAMPEATFTFAHIIKPHKPVVFDSTGQIIPGVQEPTEEEFFDQLQFINDRTIAMVDAILEQSTVPPIIIIQGDHGSVLGDGGLNGHRVLFEILNAVRFPGTEAEIPQDLTPVNTFRLMFNTYFGGQYELLENRHFQITGGYADLFAMRPIDPQDVIDHPENYP